ncbi:hypothetical protein [Mesorhizobium sp. ES1-4]|nr:hypothetical protein [Mesorhizobium sp. ES1-4]MBZ9799590.1 hypothetical protein [Mesorhizobium sp. ES1-4]
MGDAERAQFGRRSERLDTNQLALALEEFELRVALIRKTPRRR